MKQNQLNDIVRNVLAWQTTGALAGVAATAGWGTLKMARIFLRFVLPAAMAVIVGFLALAYAIPNEPTLSAPLVSLISPGLKVAELTVPTRHESLATTFGWFLRIAIAVNTAFYFVLFAAIGHLFARRR